jgi:hypothetical protein
MIVSNWDYICFIFFAFYYLKNSGLSSILFPLLIFLYFIIEEKVAGFYMWKISFIYVSFLILCKFII